MNNTKLYRILFTSLILLMIFVSSFGSAFATSSSDLDEINRKIEETNNDIKEVKKEMTSALTQISNLNSEITLYENEIEDLTDQISGLESQIALKENEIAEEQQKYDIQNELLQKRLVAMYEMGSLGYIDILLSSGSLYELVSNYYIISEVAENDKELLAKIEETKNAIIAQKEYIESAKEELSTNKSNMESKKVSLANTKKNKENLVSNLTDEEAVLQQELEEFENDKREIQRKLASKAKNSAITVSPGGYATPLSGRTKSSITTGYGSYSWGGNHTGVDFAVPAGTPILAVKDGTVVISTALRRGNGTYKSYGEYIVIDHHDGTMTLYAHMSPGTRLVSEGDDVIQGQQIGSVGQTGNATGNHLHFEVRINNGRPVNPTSYLP